jgi:hypothetical protein
VEQWSNIEIGITLFEQLVQHTQRAYAKDIRENIIQFEVAHGQAVLATVFLRGVGISQFCVITTQVTQLADILGRDKTGTHQVALEKFGNPLCVPFVGFFSLDGFDIFGVCQADVAGLFKGIENRNPVFSRGFHTNILAVVD